MKIKLDENLPASLGRRLSECGHDVHTVLEERLVGAVDSTVMSAAEREERLLVTQDVGISTRWMGSASTGSLMLVRLREPSARALTERLVRVFETQVSEEWQGALVVVSDRKIRIRKRGQ